MLTFYWGGRGENAEHSDIKKENFELRLFFQREEPRGALQEISAVAFPEGLGEDSNELQSSHTQETPVLSESRSLLCLRQFGLLDSNWFPKTTATPCQCSPLCEPHASPVRGQGKHSRAQSMQSKSRDQGFNTHILVLNTYRVVSFFFKEKNSEEKDCSTSPIYYLIKHYKYSHKFISLH